MDKGGDRLAGISDEYYNLVSVLYHALKIAENCDAYGDAASAVGELELADFFHNVKNQQEQLADKALRLLNLRTPTSNDRSPQKRRSGDAIS